MKKISVITGLVLLTVFALLASTALAQSDTPTIPSVPSGYEDMMDGSYGYMGNGFRMMDVDSMGSFSDWMGEGFHMGDNGFAWMSSYGSDMRNGSDFGMGNGGSGWMGGDGFGMMGGRGSGMWGSGSAGMNDGSTMGNDFSGMGGIGR